MKGKAEDVLRPSQHRVIQALLVERTHKEAAKVAKVPLRTLQAWLTEPSFVKEYNRLRRVANDEYAHQVGLLGKDALDALKRNLSCGKEGVEVRAAIGLLNHRMQVHQMQELQDQLDELRQQLEEQASREALAGAALENPPASGLSLGGGAPNASRDAFGGETPEKPVDTARAVSTDADAKALDAFLAGDDPGRSRGGFAVQ